MVTKPESWDKVYPDTPEGAKEYLFADSTCKPTEHTACVIDDYVEGVWLITNLLDHCGMKCEAIVYLKGYKEPLGDIRERNDFETLEGWQTQSQKTTLDCSAGPDWENRCGSHKDDEAY